MINSNISDYISSFSEQLAREIVQEICWQYPDLQKKYGNQVVERCVQDNIDHLTALAEAIEVDSPTLFVNYIAWSRTFEHCVMHEDFNRVLVAMSAVFQRKLTQEGYAVINLMIDKALSQLADEYPGKNSYFDNQNSLSTLAQNYTQALLNKDRVLASRLIMNAVENGVHIQDLYMHVFQTSQYEIGRLWQQKQISVAQEHFCTAATQMIMSQLYPHFLGKGKKDYLFLATSVESNLHEIGIRMIADLLEMDGWKTYYLGANMPNDDVVSAAIDMDADVLGVSATLTSHVHKVTELIQSVRAIDTLKNLKIIVGGYPFNLAPTLYQKVGADAYARDGETAVETINQLLAKGTFS